MSVQTCYLGPSGGNFGATPPNGPQPVPEGAVITGFMVSSSTQIVQITTYYSQPSSQGTSVSSVVFGAPEAGSTSGTFALNPGELVSRVYGFYEDIVQTITFVTTLENKYSFGSTGSGPPGSGQQYYQYDIPSNTTFAGFWGFVSAPTNINAMGVILYAPAAGQA